MRIFKGFSNQISKVNTIFSSEQTDFYIYRKKLHNFTSKN